MKILLASPRRSAFTGESISAPHIGLLSIASALREGTFADIRSVDVRVVDDQVYWIQNPESEPGDCIQGYCADIVGVQAVTAGIKNAIHLLRKVFECSPRSLKVLGGVASSMVQELFSTGYVDVIVRGEGEHTFSDLVQAYGETGLSGLRKVSGITYKNHEGKVIENKDRPSIDFLDKIPLPARDLVDINLYRRISKGRVGNVITSRGCSFSCPYCYSKHQWGIGQRHFSVDRAVLEIRVLVEDYKLDRIRIEDDHFFEDRQRVLTFCNALKETGLSKKIEWEAKGRPEQLDEEILRITRDTGNFRVMTGVETLNSDLLKRINRKVPIETIKRALDSLKKCGVGVQATIILGIPGETIDSMRKTLDWLDNRLSGRDIIGPCFFTPFAKVHKEMMERVNYTIEVHDTDYYAGHVPITSSPECSYEDLLSLYEEIGKQRQGSYKRIGHLRSMEEIRKRINL